MSKLRQLRGKLAALRRARLTAQWGTGLCAIAIAVLAALGGLFALDVYFELSVMQRLLMFAVAIAVVVWAARRYAVSYFHAGESIEAMALQVERQHRIQSDLIAALQFESPAASAWGSTALEERVVTRVADTSPRLDVFVGFSRETLLRRSGILLAMALVAVVGGLLFPEYARVFGQRLLLGSEHYPTATSIERIYVGEALALERSADGLLPSDIKLPQGREVTFVIASRGVAPVDGKVALRDSSGREREVAVTQLSLEARRQRLEAALELAAASEIAGGSRSKAAALVAAEAPALANDLRDSAETAAVDELQQMLADWPQERFAGELYAGELPRLIASVDYQVYLGDAWTDRARIEMIGLPVVEIEYRITPPSYAVDADRQQRVETGIRRLSVLEGSRIDVVARCVNGKTLEEVTLALHDRAAAEAEPPQQLSFEAEGDGAVWKLNSGGGPLASFDRELQLSISCRDSDGLTLEAPLTCWVRLEADRPPTAVASVVHKVVLPDAAPVVEFRATDDYALASIVLLVDVERERDGDAAVVEAALPASAAAEGEEEQIGLSRATERHEVHVAPAIENTVIAGPWPHAGRHSLDLSPFSLVKGDHIKLTLQVTDYRGEGPGETTFSDPLIVEVSDESGVLAAISEADSRSEQRLNDLIKRQLGIGESP